ncbi:MAG: aspartate aminotransferase family protein [Microscillaceae bacterium]|nr:aspartate aminotransferase family protein [Microscillaceae bacterium]MDW8460340.1 aspartate aminotransferase family protein [Cytophagales bacterium]
MPSQRELFFRYLAQTSPSPLAIEIAYAQGVYLYTSEGKKIIDLISGIAVSNVGHRHPKVQQAIENQLNKYWHVMVYGELIQSPQNELAYHLCQTLPSHLNNVYFTNSGSEAIEGAMKLAKRFTQRTQIITCYNAYHGSSQGALSISGNEKFKQAYRPLLPDIQYIHYGSFSDLDKITRRTAAVFVETIQGEAGVKIACTHYFQALQCRCREVGALLVLDEIQSGFGRTGKFWAFEHFAVQPDILVCAKGMGGGMPIGAFISSQEIMRTLTYNPILGHITTFGGHPVSCAASLATLQVIQEENLLAQVEPKAQLFRELLKHPKILNFRNIGLMIALEFENFATLKPIIDKAIQLGVLTDWFLYCDNAMRIAPPLIITESQIREACQLILQAIEAGIKHN